jgi:hypothetical protein
MVVVCQIEIARLQAKLDTDVHWTQSQQRFLNERGAILHKHDKVTVPGGPVTHRAVRSLDSIDCEAKAEDLQPEETKRRLRLQGVASKLDYWRQKLAMWETTRCSLLEHRHEYHDVTTAVFYHYRGMKDAADKHLHGSAAKKHALKLAVQQSSEGFPELRDKAADAVSPLSILGSLFDVAMQRAQTDSKHVRFPPILINFALNIINKSPSTYAALRAALPSLPSPSTLSHYTYVPRSAHTDTQLG